MQRARSTPLEACSNGGAASEKAALLAEEEALKPSVSEDPELLAAQASAALEASRRAFACRVVAGGLGVLFVVLLACQGLNASSTPDEARSFSSRCLSSSGGGVIGPRGSLLHFSPSCTVELREYFDGAYFAEVRRVADDAITYFRALVARQNRQDQLAGAAGPRANRGTVVFDIDETALSNLDSFFSRTAPWSRLLGSVLGGAAGRGAAGLGDGDCVYPHLEYMPFAGAPASPPLVLMAGKGAGGAVAGEGSAGVGVGGGVGAGAWSGARPLLRLCSSPPLRATLDLYNFLAANNFTLVFLTGRSEDARAQTAANLEEAGYGSLCPSPSAGGATAADALSLSEVFDAATAPSRSSSAGSAADGGPRRYRRHLAQQGQGQGDLAASPADDASSSAGATGSSGSGSSSLAAPCYAALIMRRVGDERLASVFKAEARAALAAGGGAPGGGHVIVGNIGDQFSDLVGEAAGTASFKLPNPVYTLL